MFNRIITGAFLLCVLNVTTVSAQNHHREQAVLHEVSNKEVVQSVYPTAAKVDKVNDFWFRILDEKGKALGFAMSSMPYCKDVKGYQDNTPVMIIFNVKGKIQKVALLSNYESPKWVGRLVSQGFFDLWNGKTIKEAKQMQVDAHTGATFTATAVIKNVSFLLENGAGSQPRR